MPSNRSRRSFAACGFAAFVSLLIGCGQPEAPSTTRGLSREMTPYLVDPGVGDPLARDAAVMDSVRRLHGELSHGAAPAAIESEARALWRRDPALHPAAVVAGQAALVSGRPADAVLVLRPVVGELPEYVAAQLVVGRAAELLGQTAAAHAAFEAVESRQPLARRRAAELRDGAIEALRGDVRAALDQGAAEAAAGSLARLEDLQPEDHRTFELRAETRALLGDRAGELQALRWLAPDAAAERRWVERRAAVELEVGDAAAGVALLESLAKSHPREPELEARLGAAKARWRLQLLPPQVVEISQRPELSRADLAVLLYWMVPEVRSARPPAAAIVTDVHDHPHRTELLRAINLGLLRIDDTRYLFSPQRSARREEAIAALLGAQELRSSASTCAERPSGAIPDRAALCAAAVACGWIAEVADCLPAAPLSGADFLAWARPAAPPQ